jgi:hypothetical protein
MDRPPTVEEVDSELSGLDKRLAEYNELIARKQALLEYRAILGRLGLNHIKAAAGSPATPSVSTGAAAVETSAIARKILSGVPQMSEGDIVREARRQGWASSGDEARDKNRFYAAMHRKKDVFEKVPGVSATWRLKR